MVVVVVLGAVGRWCLASDFGVVSFLGFFSTGVLLSRLVPAPAPPLCRLFVRGVELASGLVFRWDWDWEEGLLCAVLAAVVVVSCTEGRRGLASCGLLALLGLLA